MHREMWSNALAICESTHTVQSPERQFGVGARHPVVSDLNVFSDDGCLATICLDSASGLSVEFLVE